MIPKRNTVFLLKLLLFLFTMSVLFMVKYYNEENLTLQKERERSTTGIPMPMPPRKVKTVKTSTSKENNNQKLCEQGINCHLPDCLCFGMHDNPPHMRRSQVPQMVVFASDDSLNMEYANYYRQIFRNHKNPNGCPYTGTMFLSDADGLTFINNTHYDLTPQQSDTNYTLVREFYDNGWEVSQHGFRHIKHRVPNVLKEDIAKMTKYTHAKTGIPMEHLNQGWRSPYLRTIGRGEIETVPNFVIQYTMNFESKRQGWPFTLDYEWREKRYLGTRQGFWIFPMMSYSAQPFRSERNVTYIDDVSITRDHPVRINTASEINRILNEAFDIRYHGDRSIFIINTHGSVFYRNPRTLPALVKFYKRLSKLKDVFVVSAIKALQWVKEPVPLENIKNFKPWMC